MLSDWDWKNGRRATSRPLSLTRWSQKAYHFGSCSDNRGRSWNLDVQQWWLVKCYAYIYIYIYGYQHSCLHKNTQNMNNMWRFEVVLCNFKKHITVTSPKCFVSQNVTSSVFCSVQGFKLCTATLLRAGADPELRNEGNGGRTPLMEAAGGGYKDIVPFRETWRHRETSGDLVGFWSDNLVFVVGWKVLRMFGEWRFVAPFFGVLMKKRLAVSQNCRYYVILYDIIFLVKICFKNQRCDFSGTWAFSLPVPQVQALRMFPNVTVDLTDDHGNTVTWISKFLLLPLSVTSWGFKHQALHYAAYHGHLPVVMELLKSNPNKAGGADGDGTSMTSAWLQHDFSDRRLRTSMATLPPAMPPATSSRHVAWVGKSLDFFLGRETLSAFFLSILFDKTFWFSNIHIAHCSFFAGNRGRAESCRPGPVAKEWWIQLPSWLLIYVVVDT